MGKDQKDRFVRWQGYTISQFTFALNLFLGLAVGTLAFSVTLLKEDSFSLNSCLGNLFLGGLVFLCLSVVSGCCAVVSRLLDFRLTAQKIKDESNGAGEDVLGVYDYKTKLLGRISWRIFWVELTTFALGLTGIVVTIFGKYGGKLILS